MIDLPPLEGRWRELTGRAVFRLTGGDRVRYLNGQVTNDVAKVSPALSLPACFCTIKGKVEALIWIHADGESLLIDGEGEQREALQARLEKYLIADDCEVEDVSGEMRLFHHFKGGCGGGAVSRRLGSPGRDLWLPHDAAPPFGEPDRIGEAEWAVAEVLSVVPLHGREIHAEEFPAELGLDAWAVDFHKGCYLGQEIVSRIRSVGRVKRLLRVVAADHPLLAGDSVSAPSGESGIVSRPSLADGRGREVALALFSVPSPGTTLTAEAIVQVNRPSGKTAQTDSVTES